MSLFSKKPKSIADFEKEIEKLRQKKKLSARNSERLEEYEKQLSTLKTAEEAAQKKKARQKKIAIGSIAASLALVTCIIIAGCISESGTVESPAVSPGYTISDSANGTTTPSDTGSDNSSSSEASASPTTSNATTPAKESNSSFAGTQQTEPPKQTEQSNPPAQNVESTYILNVNTKKFHYPSCSSVKQMSDKNKQTYTGSRDDLISQGYDPCKKCNP